MSAYDLLLFENTDMSGSGACVGGDGGAYDGVDSSDDVDSEVMSWNETVGCGLLKDIFLCTG